MCRSNIYKVVSAAILIFSTIYVAAQSTRELKVLFIGNSYTAVNNLPEMLVDIAKSTNDIMLTGSNTPGGCTFQMHTTNNSAVMIAKCGWDYVILQEQSQLPALDSITFFTESYPFAQQLDSMINSNNECCETVFYMTWGRRDGDAEFCNVFPPVCTYEGMDDLLFERYMLMADDNNAIVSPVGAVWRELRNSNPDMELYSSDGSHPSLSGSYAAACVFYAVILRKDPTLITQSFTLPEDDAVIIRNAVKNVVYNKLNDWYVGKYDSPVKAGFNIHNDNSLIVYFNNISENANSYYWDFGDGNFSEEMSPCHEYSSNGEYTVTLIAKDICNHADTVSDFINLNFIGTYEEANGSFNIYPNPSDGIFIVESRNFLLEKYKISIYSMSGNIMKTFSSNNSLIQKIDLTDLSSGIYKIVFVSDKGIESTISISKM